MLEKKPPNDTGPTVLESDVRVGLHRISEADTSLNGREVQFVLDDCMAGLLVEVITRANEILHVEAVVHVAPAFQVTEKENVRDVVLAVAQSVIKSWD
jgi:hypothetical protein